MSEEQEIEDTIQVLPKGVVDLFSRDVSLVSGELNYQGGRIYEYVSCMANDDNLPEEAPPPGLTPILAVSDGPCRYHLLRSGIWCN